jgi:transcriptional regulator
MSAQQDLLAESKAAVALNTQHARDMLQKRYPAPEWALMQEVAPKTGGGTRYADAVAVNLWSSRGHAVHGFEIKVSRSDWLRELKQPEKAEDIFQYCDYWWILAPRGIVKDGELPPTWGLLELRESGITQIKAAPKLAPIAITREFFASLMRRGQEDIQAAAERMQRLTTQRARDDIDQRVEAEVKRRSRGFVELQERVTKFAEETGIELDGYCGTSKAAIEMAKKLDVLTGYGKKEAPFSRLTDLAAELERAAGTVRKAIQETGLVSE